MSTTVTEEAAAEPRSDPGARSRRVPLLAVSGVLTVVAFSIRLGVLPESGFYHDDAWTTVAAMHGSPGQLLDIGASQPGFILFLMAVVRIFGLDPVSATYPALVVGSLAPAALFVFLRRLGHRTSLAALFGALLVVADMPAVFSGRAKTYVIEIVLVMALALAVRRLVRVRWRWPLAAGWVLVTVLLGTMSVFVAVAALAGGIVLALHPVGDIRVRVAALGAHAALTAAFVEVVQRSYNTETMKRFWSNQEEAFIGLAPSPPGLVGDLWRHVSQLAVVFPGGPGWFTTVCTLVFLAGLVWMCLGRQPLVGRFLVVLLGLAVVGSIAAKVPFGAQHDYGLRVSIWTVPLVASGLAAAVGAVVRPLLARRGWRSVVDVAAYAGAVGLLVSALPSSLHFPDMGTAPATAFIEDEIRDGDVVLLLFTAQFPFAAETSFPVRLGPDPMLNHGIDLEILDPRVFLVPHGVSPDRQVAAAAEAARGARRVLVMSASARADGPDPSGRVAVHLTVSGREIVEHRRFGASTVWVWGPGPGE